MNWKNWRMRPSILMKRRGSRTWRAPLATWPRTAVTPPRGSESLAFWESRRDLCSGHPGIAVLAPALLCLGCSRWSEPIFSPNADVVGWLQREYGNERLG